MLRLCVSPVILNFIFIRLKSIFWHSEDRPRIAMAGKTRIGEWSMETHRLSVVIADDDRLVLKDLQNMVDWEKLGFRIAATAASGEEALRCVDRLQPFLLITDIRMLGSLNGLDVIEQAHRKYPRMKFLVISSYDDFHYLKRAMDNDVLDYILKTDINAATLTQKLLESRSEFSRDSHNVSSGIGHELELFMASDRHEETVSLPEEEYPYLHSIAGRQYYFMLCSHHHYFARDMKSALDAWRHRSGEILKDVYSLALNYDVFPIICQYEDMILIGLSAEVSTSFSLKDFSNSLLYHFGSSAPLLQFCLASPMPLLEFRSFIRPLMPLVRYHLVFLPQDRRPLNLDEMARLCCYVPISKDFPFHALLLDEKNQENNVLLLKNYIEACVRSCDIRTLERFFRHFCVHMEIQTNNQLKFPDTLFADSPEMFQKWVYNRLEECTRFLSGGMDHAFSPPVESAIRFMLQNYQDPDISSSEIAGSAGLSVNRLGILIKKDTGRTLNEYLSQIRIEKAVELLEKTNLKIYEIAERCGYRTSQYFSQVFFQKTGRKPLDYRKGRKE